MNNIEIFAITTIVIVSIAVIQNWFQYATGYQK